MELSPSKSSLFSLPSEILQQVATYLPSRCVISLLLVNHSIRKAVDHWAVWRSFIVGNQRFSHGIPSSRGEGEGEGSWKRYVLADVMAEKWEDGGRTVGEDNLRWLPMLIVVGHPILRTLTPEMVIHLAVLPSASPQTALFERSSDKSGKDQKVPLTFPTNPDTALSIGEWRGKVAGSFCLAMSHMSSLALRKEEEAAARRLTERRDSDESGDEEDPETETRKPYIPQLCKIPWCNIHPSSPSLSPEKRQKLITALHALSLSALAHFSTELSLAISEYRIASTTISQISHPPTSHTLALHLSNLMSCIPDPFSPSCVEKFGMCHFRTMATPEFFEEGEWTGAFAYTGLWGVREAGMLRGRDVFDCIGGVNRMVQLNGWDKPNGRFGFVVEGVVRFRRVVDEGGAVETERDEGREGEREEEKEGGRGGEGEDDAFVLRSNCFYSQMGTHVLELRVQRSTGLIAVRQWNADGVGKEKGSGKGGGNSRGAVLTPLGVVGAMGVGASWMWLWKREWSGAVEGVE